MKFETITSSSNPRVKQVARLQRQSRDRRQTGLFCVEHARELRRAIDAGYEVCELYAIMPSDALIDRLGDAAVAQVSEAVLRKMAYREHPDDFVAVLRAVHRTAKDLSTADHPLYVICSGLEKPGNLGAILRSADAAGAAAVLIDSPDADLYNPNTIRASTGAVFALPVVCDSPQAIQQTLRERGVRLIAATPDASTDWHTTAMTGPTALVLGAEDEGLDPAWRSAADAHIRIPMGGVVDSLNVSVTAAVLLFEAVRQRIAAGR